ncbi:MAG: hypothetical protein A2268_05955 [Candidatus Raymondbacteria bacterium RifOxyA12_full_50_37]|uniref:Uncharacterized protein n=1 Tax=Candidatus Raymondbacteria bacterium RIFOXYD12_FULL_49_13 TaxID=1817890 RepID=A0A1F7FGH0_UNCRA|nr:MAG: hypothetical protein A2268_05955 [Candidatus Raymondbacteria bacterium RifOxyA12_full_50_37]OGJ94284.1 MAG: hypothetical protein A2248_14885 [Candidatus Raymondbacteria bacterium RIFOXYA2_FULL_49_16]OGJ99114.1 MAG: hypothetical protein A2453_11295 [Candidatus Raymondbacteria bacterium RIFOXYC2_FULL_50_21]OGK01253.1 MAG: hypothetical protein A2350_20630 [Candidatus Raymondbacteria bacterium RifOxyB12_full_50_8]OGK05566.1 MAG: hypothetical protein A2519_11690 [Candidatus Raymondbacteria b
MYLTSQRVVSKDGQEGINSFFHLHRPHKQPKLKGPADITAVAEDNTGKLIKDNCEVEPGGNRVKSYLDIVAPDDAGEKQITAALDNLQGEIDQSKMWPITYLADGIGIRFNTDMELYKALEEEFSTLKASALALLRSARK